ncbi:hypothetical protein LNKW23_16950 [Paralimibaculum aggregatum]|uniref:Phytanoyl-CoA dioxygenase n=1 Tax=Paralimibaculum aggregatum TaxID=3036245 RepID=A0ABQ6LHM8_9RHOB|nr:phytanoyl-CoA dioxygenase family protein [Limibaculum sp. NKW23]GMG82482.1 hypothetical protein LNKW23_16950 [Limibaculum sp. NKW23]
MDASAKSEARTNPLPGWPLVESPLYADLVEAAGLDAEERRIADELNQRGYAVLDFPDPEFDTVAERLKAALVKRPEFADVAKIGPGNPVQHSRRIQDHVSNDDVRRIACNARIIALLGRLYGRRAFPFQTLNFPMGTQQKVHSDSAHFSSIPERFMCGVWVALEDIGPEQGPLIYYPGSHRWPVLHADDVGHARGRSELRGQAIYQRAWEAMIEAHGVEPAYFHARKGQALIWAANLLHGGSPHTDRTRTRFSQVTHYFFEDCAYCTPMKSNMRLGATVFRDRVRNIETGELVPNLYAGQPVANEITRYRKDQRLSARVTEFAREHGLRGLVNAGINRLAGRA